MTEKPKKSRFERAGDDDDEDGGASVREPVRPKPKKPEGGAALPIPEEPELIEVGS